MPVMISSRSGLGFRRTDTPPKLLAHLQEVVYSEVGQHPPSSSWVTQIGDTFTARVGTARQKALAQRAATASLKKGGGTGAGKTPPGAGKEGSGKFKLRNKLLKTQDER